MRVALLSLEGVGGTRTGLRGTIPPHGNRHGLPADRSVDQHGASRQRQSRHHSHARAFLPSRRRRGNHAPQALGQASKWKHGRRRSNTARREREGTDREGKAFTKGTTNREGKAFESIPNPSSTRSIHVLIDPYPTHSIPYRHASFVPFPIHTWPATLSQPQSILPHPMLGVPPNSSIWPKHLMAIHPEAYQDCPLDAWPPEPEGNPAHGTDVRGNSSEKDGGEHQACRVVGPIARTQPRPGLLSNRGARARERPPFRKVVRRRPTHGISMKQHWGLQVPHKGESPTAP